MVFPNGPQPYTPTTANGWRGKNGEEIDGERIGHVALRVTRCDLIREGWRMLLRDGGPQLKEPQLKEGRGGPREREFIAEENDFIDCTGGRGMVTFTDTLNGCRSCGMISNILDAAKKNTPKVHVN